MRKLDEITQQDLSTSSMDLESKKLQIWPRISVDIFNPALSEILLTFSVERIADLAGKARYEIALRSQHGNAFIFTLGDKELAKIKNAIHLSMGYIEPQDA